MLSKKLISLLIIVSIIFFLGVCFFTYFNYLKPKNNEIKLNPDEILQIAKADKDYADISNIMVNFDPKIKTYEKLGPEEYSKIKSKWKDEGFESRIELVDKITLTNSTYWIEITNNNDENKGLRMILDTKENKSLLLIAALSVSAGVGI